MNDTKIKVGLAAVAAVAVSACGGSGGPSVRLEPSNSPSADVVKSWPSKWCSEQPGVAKSTLYTAMGKPTSESTGQPSWDGFGWQFNAFFDENGNVRQMDINDSQLDASQRARITCETTRIAGNTGTGNTGES